MVMLNDLDRFHLVIDVIDRVPGLARERRAPAAGDGRPPPRGAGVDARARRGPARDPRLDLAALSARVLVVNAGSTSLKLLARRRGRAHDAPSLDDVVAGVDAVGHRVVHGGRLVVEPAADRRLAAGGGRGGRRGSRRCTTGPRCAAIERAREALPDVPHVAVFDTAFHATMPDEASTYARSASAGDAGTASAATASTGSPSRGSPSRCGSRGSSSATSAAAARSPRCRRPLGRHDDGLHAARGRADGDALGLGRPRRAPLPPAPGAGRRRARPRARTRSRGWPRSAGWTTRSASASSPTASRRPSAAMTAVLGGLDVLAFSGGVGENREDVRRAIADRLGHLGDFRVEVVAAARGRRDRARRPARARSVVLRSKTGALSGGMARFRADAVAMSGRPTQDPRRLRRVGRLRAARSMPRPTSSATARPSRSSP